MAAGLTHEQIAEHLGLNRVTVSKKCQGAESLPKRFRDLIGAILAKADFKAAQETRDEVKDRIRRILSKTLGCSELLVETALASGDFTQLLAAHKVGQDVAKYVIAEEPKTLRTENAGEVVHRHVIDFSEAVALAEAERDLLEFRDVKRLETSLDDIQEAQVV